MLIGLSAIFPCDHIEKTCDYYEKKLGFRAVKYLEVEQPHICLYRDEAEIILTKTVKESFVPNHIRYGYGYDAYLYTKEQESLEEEFLKAGVKFVNRLNITDYNNKEFVIEDCDGRYVAFGCK
ncbi:MAG: glyoxalase [Clostridium sp.]|nr:glyoxalase [Clostridium sp.]